jgi:hypothetical protein
LTTSIMISFAWVLLHILGSTRTDGFLKNKFAAYRKEGKIKPGAPKVPGKNALIFVTYSGLDTGI